MSVFMRHKQKGRKEISYPRIVSYPSKNGHLKLNEPVLYC